MTETAYETLPELESSETRIGASTVVMKFGGTSVADPEKIRRVASRLVATSEPRASPSGFSWVVTMKRSWPRRASATAARSAASGGFV